MQYLPGTTIAVQSVEPEYIDTLMSTLFSGGGLVLSQVTAYIGAMGYSVQNWIKRGFVSRPKAKKYSRRQFCRLAIINMLKESIPIPDIAWMLSYINGSLSDESDDTIGDDELYLYFVSMLYEIKTNDRDEIERSALNVTKNYTEPVPGAAAKIREVLVIMYYAYRSSILSRYSSELIETAKKKENI